MFVLHKFFLVVKYLFFLDKRSKSPIREEITDESSAAETADEKNSANGAESADPDDKFPATSDSEPSTSQVRSLI